MLFRTPFAVALAALLAVPAVASSAPPRKGATTRSAPAASSFSKELTIGGVVGLELGDIDGFMLRVDGQMPIQLLSPKVSLSGVGSIGFSRLSADSVVGDVTWNIFTVIPAARFTVPAAPLLDLYGDAGLGLYYGSFTTEITNPLTGQVVEADDSTTGVLMRFAVGGHYKLNPKTKLAAEIGLVPYFGDADTTNWTLSIGAMFAL